MKTGAVADKISSRERFLEAIVQSAIDYAIISMDLDGFVTSWNEGAHKILGWSSDEMIGQPAAAFFTPEDRENGVLEAEMAAAMRSGRGSDERWHLRADGTTFWASGEMMALRAPDDNVIGFIKILRDRTKEREQADRERLLMYELAHRMKNTLSVVQAIATQSLRNAASLDDASEKLLTRIAAYARAHEILLQKNWTSATLADLVDAARMNIGLNDSEQIASLGPVVELGPQAALSLAMVLHELLTNAAKYGALSNGNGRIDIAWSIERRDRAEVLVISWREAGGPAVPKHAGESTGFGSRLIASSLGAYGQATITYAPGGLMLVAELALDRLKFRNDMQEAEDQAR